MLVRGKEFVIKQTMLLLLRDERSDKETAASSDKTIDDDVM